MYAIVKVGGKQYRVEKGDSIVVDRMPEQEGAKVALQPLLFRPDGDGEPVFAGSDLEKVKVEALIRGHERGKKVRVLKFKPKIGYKRRTGHRSELTRLEIGDIKLASPRRRPAAKKASAPKGEEEEKKPAPRKRPSSGSPKRKPAAKKGNGNGS